MTKDESIFKPHSSPTVSLLFCTVFGCAS